jgi:hypothetical protein
MGQYTRIYIYINLVNYVLNVQVLSEQMPKRNIKYPNI